MYSLVFSSVSLCGWMVISRILSKILIINNDRKKIILGACPFISNMMISTYLFVASIMSLIFSTQLNNKNIYIIIFIIETICSFLINFLNCDFVIIFMNYMKNKRRDPHYYEDQNTSLVLKCFKSVITGRLDIFNHKMDIILLFLAATIPMYFLATTFILNNYEELLGFKYNNKYHGYIRYIFYYSGMVLAFMPFAIIFIMLVVYIVYSLLKMITKYLKMFFF